MWARFYLDQYKNIKLESVIFVRAKMIFVASSVDSANHFVKVFLEVYKKLFL